MSNASTEAKRLTQQAMDDLVAAVEAGKSDQLKAYLAMLGRMHRYSFGNVLCILRQRPKATFVAGYRRWKQLGRQVRKGEKAIRILAPIRRKTQKADEEQAADNKAADEAEEQPIAFKIAHVFDSSQTDGKPLAHFAQVGGDPGEAAERLKAFVRQKGIELQYSEMLSTASGYSQGGKIVLKAGMPPGEEYSVLAHELAHEILHQGENAPQERDVQETEAEAVAFAVCQGIGLDTNTAASDYIHRGDKETLLESLERIRQAAHEILEAVLPGPDQEAGSRKNAGTPPGNAMGRNHVGESLPVTVSVRSA
jgi:antirestriction protein ArdC